jgi:hypothetical protein
MNNPFSTVFHETDNQLSVEMVTVPLEEYKHLLLRVETAERMYADSKDHVAWLEKVLDIRHELWQDGLDSYMEVE